MHTFLVTQPVCKSIQLFTIFYGEEWLYGLRFKCHGQNILMREYHRTIQQRFSFAPIEHSDCWYVISTFTYIEYKSCWNWLNGWIVEDATLNTHTGIQIKQKDQLKAIKSFGMLIIWHHLDLCKFFISWFSIWFNNVFGLISHLRRIRSIPSKTMKFG